MPTWFFRPSFSQSHFGGFPLDELLIVLLVNKALDPGQGGCRGPKGSRFLLWMKVFVAYFRIWCIKILNAWNMLVHNLHNANPILLEKNTTSSFYYEWRVFVAYFRIWRIKILNAWNLLFHNLHNANPILLKKKKSAVLCFTFCLFKYLFSSSQLPLDLIKCLLLRYFICYTWVASWMHFDIVIFFLY